jgi:hypothetical protein
MPRLDLPWCGEASVTETGDVANGVRWVRPGEEVVRRYFNVVGKLHFGPALSWLNGPQMRNAPSEIKAMSRSDQDGLAIDERTLGRLIHLVSSTS